MKKISDAQLDLIDALVAEYNIGGLNASILEKDIHVTDTLCSIMAISDPKIRLVFCGGTSLSKAFHLVERMSEDIDIKIDIKPLLDLSISARKNYLSDFKNKIKQSLIGIGLIEDPKMAHASNANHLFSMEWFYHSEYQNNVSLRPRLKIEIKTCEIQCPVEQKNINYLANTLANIQATHAAVTCQAIEETLSEKVISFLRRYDRAIYMKEKWDGALIRHIYDVYCIVLNNEEIIKKSKVCFPTLIAHDAREYGNQHEPFKSNPVETLFKSLENSQSDASLAFHYQEKLIPLIFGNVKPSFIEAHTKFSELAKELLSAR